ncbi:hypothetical protein T484DRAFT_1788914 [Baffinella frigidus]|nr:hypothetical protein T484DRAFT_1788914 [Cryptophyta sp. CCMP2293]
MCVRRFPIAGLVSEWRTAARYSSTFTDALAKKICPRTERIHTSFCMAATATGRLSSQEPNLQNIPTATKEGTNVRKAFQEGTNVLKAFQATGDRVLLSADYSQVPA